jgi:hypothetical protein
MVRYLGFGNFSAISFHQLAKSQCFCNFDAQPIPNNQSPIILKTMPRDFTTKLIFIFVLFLCLFNFPILSIFGKEKYVLGLPIQYMYIFIAWILLIILIGWTVYSSIDRYSPKRKTNK